MRKDYVYGILGSDETYTTYKQAQIAYHIHTNTKHRKAKYNLMSDKTDYCCCEYNIWCDNLVVRDKIQTEIDKFEYNYDSVLQSNWRELT